MSLCKKSRSEASKKPKKRKNLKQYTQPKLEDSDQEEAVKKPSYGASISSLQPETRSRKRAAARLLSDAELKKKAKNTPWPLDSQTKSEGNDDHESDKDTSSDEEEESYQHAQEDSEFIHTTLFGELQEDYVFYKGGSSCRLISLLGPKGLGKTTSMKQLMDADDMYIDLVSISDDITVPKDCKTLFIDNAQVYDKDKVPHPLKPEKLRMKFVVAAFSPGIRCQDGHHNLSKACGDGLGVDFYFHPFEWEEAKQIPSVLGFKIGKENSLQKRSITQRRLNWLFCVTNGSPRYMKWYLEQFKLSRMQQELRIQYDQAESANAQKNIPLSNMQIDQKILDLILSGEGEDSSPAAYLGLAYCIENSGCSKYKPASMYFASRAYSNLTGTVLASKWQRLEMLTQLLISATVCEIINAKDTMALPRANHCIYQPDIGIKCDSKVRNGAVTLLVLAEGHNVVDFILYDRRLQKANVFFIQTSSACYASKKKDKMACLTHLVKKDDICISEVAISDYYTKFLKHNFIYVFATTHMLNWKFHSDIYFLDLLKFNPAVYGTTDECH